MSYNNAMDRLLVFGDYLSWHYAGALRDIVRLWLNLLWFLHHFFSIPLLVRTLFTPFKRISSSTEKGASPQAFIETFLFNGITRVIGALMRLVLISTGVTFLVLVLLGGIVTIILWLALPVIIIFLLSRGLTSFFN